jgi:hypothetical protein
LKDKVSNRSHVGLVGWRLMTDIASSRERAEVVLGVAQMSCEIGAHAFGHRTYVPETEVRPQNRLLCKNNMREIDYYLLFGHGRVRVFRHIGQIVNAVKNGVDGLGDVMVHLVQWGQNTGRWLD